MKCVDYGVVFVPQKYGLNYCKSPQAIIYEDFIRVYFSYCVNDGEKLKSRVGFVDFSMNFREIIKISDHVLLDGGLGAFDEHGVFPFSPFRDGNQIKAITTGWSRKQSVSAETSLGLVESFDGGETFERIGSGPVMTANLREPFLVADGFVVKLDKKGYVMYYIFGTEWGNYEESDQPERTYRIGMAYSRNLLDWKRDSRSIICERYRDEAQALPSVIFHNEKWHMFFCYRHTVGFRHDSNMSYRIGYASSDDMTVWERHDERIEIPLKEWNEHMQCYPNVICINNDLFLLYNGNSFGKQGFGVLKLEDV